MKKIIFLIIILALGLAAYGYFMSGESPSVLGEVKDSNSIFFYGRECPHCKVVEKFMKENGVVEKMSFVSAEIYHNKENQELFREKFSACGVTDEKKMGVPMLWVENKCVVGDKDIIVYFKEKIGL